MFGGDNVHPRSAYAVRIVLAIEIERNNNCAKARATQNLASLLQHARGHRSSARGAPVLAVWRVRGFLQLSLGQHLPDTLRIQLGEFKYTQFSRSPFVIEGAGIADLPLQQLQIHRINRKLQACIGSVWSRIYRTICIIRTLVHQERTLKLNFAAQTASIALASLVRFIPVND